jgi:hypothetical protein
MDATQAGFDPQTPAADSARTPETDFSSADVPVVERADYFRADGACLMARNSGVE